MSARRRGRARPFWLALWLLAVAAAPSVAQPASPGASSADDVDRADTDDAAALDEAKGDEAVFEQRGTNGSDAAAADVDALPEAALVRARDLLKEGQLEAADALLRGLRRRGGLNRQELARAWLLQGMADVLLEQTARDRRLHLEDPHEARPDVAAPSEAGLHAFGVALRLSRDLDPGLKQPLIRRPFDAAKASLPPAVEALWARATWRSANGGLPGGVRVELVADDLGLVHAVRRDRAAPQPLSASAPLAFLTVADESPPAQVALLDEHGNTLMEVRAGHGEALAPATAQADDPAEDKAEDDSWLGRFKSPRWAVADWPWLTLAGAGVGGAGLVMAVGAGALVAIYDRGLILPEAIDPVFKPAMFVGVGVGVVVMLVGVALIATDQIVRGELYKASPSDDETDAVDYERPPDHGETDTHATAGARSGSLCPATLFPKRLCPRTLCPTTLCPKPLYATAWE